MMKITTKKYAQILLELHEDKRLDDSAIRNFIKLLLMNGDLRFLNNILDKFSDLLKIKKGIGILSIESLEPLEENFKEKILELVKNKFHKNQLIVQEIIDPKIVGGLRLKLDNNYLIDVSLRRFIDKIKY